MGLRSPNRVLDKNSEVKRTGEMEEAEGVGPWGGNQSSLGTSEAEEMLRKDGASLFCTSHAACLAAKQSVVIYRTEESRSLKISWFSQIAQDYNEAPTEQT